MSEKRSIETEARIHSGRKKESYSDFRELSLTPRAVEMANSVKTICSSTDQDVLTTERTKLDTVLTGEMTDLSTSRFRFSNFQELRDLVLPLWENGEHSRLTGSDRTNYWKAFQIYVDLCDAFSVGTMGLKTGSSPERVVKTKLGLDSKFNGVEKVVVDSYIDDPEIQRQMKFLETALNSQGNNLDIRIYEKYIDRIESLGSADPKQQEMVLQYLNSILGGIKFEREYLSGNRIPEVPKTYAEQLRMARYNLDIIEGFGSKPGDLIVTEQAANLLTMLMKSGETLDPRVKVEIQARLHLRHAFILMNAAGGFLDPQIRQSIPNALQELYDSQSELSGRDLIFFLRDKEDIHNLATGEAWDLLQEINFGSSYPDLMKEISANAAFMAEIKADRNFWIEMGYSADEYFREFDFDFRKIEATGRNDKIFMNPNSEYWAKERPNNQFDADVVRMAIVDRFLKKKLATKLGRKENDYGVVKGLELARQLIVATGEDAPMNPGFAGHHDLSELTMTLANTMDREGKAKPIGSRDTIFNFVSLAPTWIRANSGSGDASRMIPLVDKDGKVLPLLRNMIDFTSFNKPKGSEYFWYTAIIMKKIMPIQALIMKEDVKLDELLSVERMKSIYEQTGKVAKYGSIIKDEGGNIIPLDQVAKKEKRIRELLVEGFVTLLSDRFTLQGSLKSLDALGRVWTRPITIHKDDGSEDTVSFVSAEFFKQLKKKVERRMAETEVERENVMPRK